MFSSLTGYLSNVKSVIAAILIGAATIVGGHQTQPLDLGANVQAIADFRTSLSSSISNSATTMTLVSFTSGSDTLVQGATYGFKLGGQEYVVGTASSNNQITGMTRGLSRANGTSSVAAYASAWGRGTSVEITDAPILLDISNKIRGVAGLDNTISYDSAFPIATSSNKLVFASWVAGAMNVASTSAYNTLLGSNNTWPGTNLFNALATFADGITSNGASTFNSTINVPYSVASSSAASVGYTNDLAIAGSPNASLTTKGIVEIATQTEAASSTATGSTGASLVIPASAATSTYNAATAPLRVVVTGNDGLIDSGFLPSVGAAPLPSDGSDGIVVLDGVTQYSGFATLSGSTYTFTRDVYPVSLTVNSGVTASTTGFRIVAQDTITNNGMIGMIGGNGGDSPDGSGSGSTAGAAGVPSATTTNSTLPGGQYGVPGAPGSNPGPDAGIVGLSSAYPISTSTGASTVSALGGSSNPAIASSSYPHNVITAYNLFQFTTPTGTTIARFSCANGSASGGTGISNSSGQGGAGGGSGASGGCIFMSAKTIVNNGIISSKGGNGGRGAQGGNTPWVHSGGSGGSGGNGGAILLLYKTLTNTGSIDVSGGAAGTKGPAGTAGGAGPADGNAGNIGSIIRIQSF